jgi:hypothetical protein
MAKRKKHRAAGAKSRATETRTAETRTAETRTAETRTTESRTGRAGSRTPKAPAGSRTPDAVRDMTEPQFWFGFEVAWAKLALARVVLFGMLAADALLQIRHAPRYRAGDFNVAHLPGLDWLAPGRVGFGVAELVQAYLFVVIACGVATRQLVPGTAAIYAWLYFGSQLDSYQHHYLVAILLVLACFVPWQRPAGGQARVRSWALRVMLVQLGIMYLWAAISKLDPAWLGGTTLAGQLGGFVRHVVDATIGVHAMSYVVVAAEFVLAATIWLRPAWWIAAPLGILFHVGIAFSKLEIGLFAWLMVALYILVVPDAIWVWLAAVPGRIASGLVAGLRRVAERASAIGARFAIGTIVLGLGVGLGLVIAGCRFEGATGVAIAISLVAGAAAGARAVWGRRERIAQLALVHVLALVVWIGVDHMSTVALDYYKFWGRTARRGDDKAAAEHAYRRLAEIAPDDPLGHYQLARLLLDRGANDEGLAELHAAARVDVGHARTQIYEARWLAARGSRDEAIAKAREATQIDPADVEARDLLAGLTAGTKLPARHDDRD